MLLQIILTNTRANLSKEPPTVKPFVVLDRFSLPAKITEKRKKKKKKNARRVRLRRLED